MSAYFCYDADKGTGFIVTDDDIAQAGKVFAVGWGVATLYGLLTLIAGLAILAPLFTLLFLDDFVNTVIVNNAAFFAAVGVALVALKAFRKTTSSTIVRLLFDGYILVTALYVLLYVLHLDIGAYAIFRAIDARMPEEADRALIDLLGRESLVQATDGHWFYNLINTLVDSFTEYTKWNIQNLVGIDASCLSAPAAEINVLEVIKTVGMYVGIGAFALVTVLGYGLLLLVGALLSMALPYVLAVAVVIGINKLIFHIRVALLCSKKQGEKLEKARRIGLDELQALESKPSISPQQKAQGYQSIAKAGNPWAQFLYAQCLMEGKGVREDVKQALYWYEKSARKGLTESRVMAAIAYYGGLGTKKNKLLAKLWLTCAVQDEQFKEKYGKQEKIISILAEIEHKTRFADCW